jgi:hypothetical protein
VAGLASKFSTQLQHAGLPIHWRHTNPECADLSKQIGQVNQTSSASNAHAGINIGWDAGGTLHKGLLLGLAGGLAGDLSGDLVGGLCLAGGLCLKGGGLHLWGGALTLLLRVLTAPGASLLGCGKFRGG